MPIVYIPEYINPFRFAEQHARLQGVVNIEDLKRLGLALNKQAGEVAVDVQFDIDEQGLVFLHGHLNAKVILQCQRCMGNFEYEIIDTFTYGVANTEKEVSSFPGKYDTVEAEDNLIAIRNIIEIGRASCRERV